MIIRFVKMTFHVEHQESFENLFKERRHLIGGFPGCRKVELLRDTYADNNTIVYFTRSIWNSHKDLEAYRASDLFQDTWKHTKALFASKAEAWSLELAAEYPD